jgi:hypothetical protein
MEIPVETHHPRDLGGPQEHQKRQQLQVAKEQKVRVASSRPSALRFLGFRGMGDTEKGPGFARLFRNFAVLTIRVYRSV